MTRFSVQPRYPILVKGYGFLSFDRNIGKSVGKNISKNLSSKYSQKLLNHAKQSATDAFTTASKRVIQKTTEETGHLIGNKIANKITRVLKSSPKNNSETTLHKKYLYLELFWSVNFTGNLEKNPEIFFIIEEAKETVLDFSERTVKVL